MERAPKECRGIDEMVMGEFVMTRGCRRTVMSMYLDGTGVECEGMLARCDHCGEGLTSVQREYMREAAEQEQFTALKLDGGLQELQTKGDETGLGVALMAVGFLWLFSQSC